MLGFTKQEQIIVLFLILSLMVGCLVSLYTRYIGHDSIQQVNPYFVEEFHKRTQEIESSHENTEINKTAEISSADNDRFNHSYIKSALLDPSNDSKEGGNVEYNISGQNKFLININKAPQKELQNIPQIGPVLAKRIIDYRSKYGGFKNVEDLEEVKGIGPLKLKKIEPYISIK